jgi:hypothetical protein
MSQKARHPPQQYRAFGKDGKNSSGVFLRKVFGENVFRLGSDTSGFTFPICRTTRQALVKSLVSEMYCCSSELQ